MENLIYAVNGDIEEAMEMYYDEFDYDMGIDDSDINTELDTIYCRKNTYEATIDVLKDKFIEFAKDKIRMYNLSQKKHIALKSEDISISSKMRRFGIFLLRIILLI